MTETRKVVIVLSIPIESWDGALDRAEGIVASINYSRPYSSKAKVMKDKRYDKRKKDHT